MRRLRQFTSDPKECEELLTNSNYFENLAIDLLSQFRETCRNMTLQMLTRTVHILNGRTCLELASDAKALQFLSHISCQNLFDTIWYGQILPDTPFSQMLLAILFPPYLFALKYRSKKDIKEMTSIYSEDVWSFHNNYEPFLYFSFKDQTLSNRMSQAKQNSKFTFSDIFTWNC